MKNDLFWLIVLSFFNYDSIRFYHVYKKIGELEYI